MPPSGTLTNGWYYRLLGEEFGPVSRDVLDSLIAEGQLGSSDEVRHGDAGTWQPVSQLIPSASAATSHNGRAMEGTAFTLESLSAAGLEELETVTESPAKASASSKEQWFYQSFGQEWGPLDFEQLLQHAREGELGADDMIRLGAHGKWRRAGSMGRLVAVMPYATKQVKTIPTGTKKSSETEDEELEIRVPLKTPEVEVQQKAAPAPAPAAPPPPPPPPPPPSPPPMMPVAGYAAYPSPYAPPVAPAWGYSQPAAPVNDQGWYAWLGGVECGPMDYNQFANWAATGRITAQDYVKQGKYSQWIAAQTVPGLIPAPVPATPPPPPAPKPVVAPAPAPTAAAAPAAKPAVQLPPPTKPAAAVPSASVSPAGSTSEPRPEPKYEPPPRPPGGDWGSSSVMSSYRPGMNLGSTASKKPAPSKSKKKSSGGGSVDVGALLQDKRVLGGLGAVLLVVGIYFGIGFLPEGTGALVKAHKDLSAILKDLEGKADSMPTDKKELDAIKAKTKKAVEPIAKSKNPAKSSLSIAKSKLDSVLSKKKPDEIKAALEDAKKKLDEAKKKLKI